MNYIFDKASIIKEAIDNLTKCATDSDAARSSILYENWQIDQQYKVGDRRRVEDILYKCIQDHLSLEGNKPSIDTAALWVRIDVQHEGSADDPIPYDGNMILVKENYYMQDNVLYKCIRNSENAVYNPLSELIDIYVQIA